MRVIVTQQVVRRSKRLCSITCTVLHTLVSVYKRYAAVSVRSVSHFDIVIRAERLYIDHYMAVATQCLHFLVA